MIILMKTIIITIVLNLIYSSCLLNAQINHLNQQHGELSSLNFSQNKIIVLVEVDEKGNLYYLDKVNEGTIKIMDFTKKEIIQLTATRFGIKYSSVNGFAVRNNRLWALVADTARTAIIIKDIKNGSQESLFIDSPVDNITLFDNYFFLDRQYAYNDNDSKTKSTIYKYNYDFELLDSIELGLTSIELSRFKPANFITFTDDYISYTDPDKVKIRLLNHNFELLDSIRMLPINFSEDSYYNFQDSIESVMHLSAIERINYMSDLLKSGYSRVVNISFINDNRLLIYYTSEDEDDIEDDINYIQEFVIEKGKLVKSLNYPDKLSSYYLPLIMKDHYIEFYKGKAYLFSMYDYKSFESDLDYESTVMKARSSIRGVEIPVNLVEIEYE